MMIRSSPVLPLLVVAAVFAAAAFFPTGTDAVWTPVKNPRDQVIARVGRFCVIVYSLRPNGSKQGLLEFVRVVRGETEPVATGGTNYHLVIEATTSGGGRTAKLYECFAWGVPGSRAPNSWQLRSFKPIAA